ncbi:MAG: hypothetical protein ACTHQQ_13575 [Solirubrobacteraceae bacterium]
MHDQSQPPTAEVLERGLKRAGTPGGTRRWLLERAAIGTAGVAAFGALDPAPAALASGDGIGPNTFGTVAVTTEALTVTLLTELLRRVNANSSLVQANVQAVFEGAYAAEVDHFRFTRAHWHPTTTKFWIPDAFFGGSGNTLSLTSVGHALVAGETLFINLYLIGVTVFAQRRQDTFARYSAELAGCESEHRVLAENLLGTSPPNNVGFEVYSLHSPKGIEHALEGAGVGFGKKGSAPGKFYRLAHPVMKPPIHINANRPS